MEKKILSILLIFLFCISCSCPQTIESVTEEARKKQAEFVYGLDEGYNQVINRLIEVYRRDSNKFINVLHDVILKSYEDEQGNISEQVKEKGNKIKTNQLKKVNEFIQRMNLQRDYVKQNFYNSWNQLQEAQDEQ